ncbi:MAG: hypothetical protein FLDDKLPJ_02428 [Phycisphaerae bacterium]|nr:hypothetical protein [Phycisphaerae bacterium]
MRIGNHRKAFSLVELVIVVVILGIIAAIAVPRISRGSRGAGDSALRSSLAAIRNAIDLYYAEHGNSYPGADGTEATLINQLTKRTDVSGNVGTTAGVHIYGPYLRGTSFPPVQVGPNKTASGVILANTGPTVDEAQTTKGWVYNYATGDFIANTDDADENSKTYNTY